jgi:ssDNA-binding Zn-finger/Zn-ribbon topoisomerase 1
VRDVQTSTTDGSATCASHVEPGLTAQMPNAQVTRPTCNAEMVLRINRSTGTGFLVCRNYPRCKGTRPA